MSLKRKSYKEILFWVLLVAIAFSFVWRLSLVTQPGHKGDFSTSLFWLQKLENPLTEFYKTTGSNYGPLYCLFLSPQKFPIDFLINRGVDTTTAQWMVFHIILIIFDLLIVLGIYFLIKRYTKHDLTALTAAALYALNPIFYYAAGQWGQADNTVFLSFLIVFWLLLNEKYIYVFPVLALSILFKPTGIVLIPFIFLIMVFEKKYLSIVFGTIISLLMIFLFSLPFFGLHIGEMVNYYAETLLRNNITPQLAVGAKSLWFLFGERRPDSMNFLGLSAKNIGFILLAIVSLLAAWLSRKNANRFLGLSLGFFVVLFGFYFLPTRSHERYQLFSFLPLIFLIIENRTRIWASILYFLSTITFALVILGIYTNSPVFQKVALQGNAISIANLLIFLAGLVLLWYYSADERRS